MGSTTFLGLWGFNSLSREKQITEREEAREGERQGRKERGVKVKKRKSRVVKSFQVWN